MVFLYTSMPIQEAITNVADRIRNPTLYLSRQDIINTMHFSVNGQAMAKQKAYLWLPASQAFWLSWSWTDYKPSLHLTIRPNRRFVDDVYLQTTGEEMEDQLHHAMNNLHPKVWNWETWNNSQWPFTVTTWFQIYYLQRQQKFLRVLQKRKQPRSHPSHTSEI